MNSCNRVALVVGHTNERRGARLFDGSSEYHYNGHLALNVLKKCNELRKNLPTKFTKEVRVFFRDNLELVDCYKEIGEWGADLSLELHVNAAGVPNANGAEVLVLTGDIQTAKVARSLLQDLACTFGSRLRHDSGIKWITSDDRGYYNLKYAKDYGVKYPMLIEPFFGDYETEESKKYVDNVQLYADVIVDLIIGA